MELLPLSPPVARLGRALGWSPLPLSVREGKRFARRRPVSGDCSRVPSGLQGNVGPQGITAGPQPSTGPACSATFGRKGAPALASASVLVDDLNLSYGNGYVVKDLTLSAVAGEILALMGRNGAGKTTLLRSLVGLLPPKKGSIRILDRNVTEEATERLARHVAFVPQDPASVLFRDSVESEIADTLAGTGREGSVEEALREWRLEPLRTAHPRDLSAGERQRAALATMLVGRPSVILLDEPTRGMDYETKELLVANLRRRCREGAAVVLASHDVELVASCADRVVLLAGGSVVATGSAREVLTESVTFSTQVNKLYGGDCLTIEDVLGPQERSHDTEA